MSGEWLLFKQFLRNPSLIGTVVPSAPALCRELVNSLELPPGGAAAELGPGTGVVTLEMLKKMPADFNFFAVELDKLIYQNFRTQFPDTAIVNANAGELDELCRSRGIDQLDAVVSGLPWASFPAEVQDMILGAVVRSLKSGGRFATFAYLQGLLLPAARRFRKKLEKEFAVFEISPVVWRNLPPAVVYRCIK